MHELLPYLNLYRRHVGQLTICILLTISTLLSNIGLLTLSGWFLASAATLGATGLYSFNYILALFSMQGMTIVRTVGRWVELVISHDATFRILQHLRLYIFSLIIPLSPGFIPCMHRGELLNRLVSDVDTLDHLYLRVISPLIGALIVTITVSSSLYLLNPQVGSILGVIMLIILILFPPLFYYTGKPIGESLTALRADYRSQLTSWISGNAELTLYGAVRRYRCRLEAIEKSWQIQQRRQNELSAIAQSLLLLIIGLTLTFVLWFLASSINSNSVSSPLLALFIFAILSVFEAFGSVSSTFQHLGKVIACALRLNVIIQQIPAVIFPTVGPKPALDVTLNINQIRFQYPQQKTAAIYNLNLTITAGEHVAFVGHTGSGKSTLLQLLTRAWDPDEGEILLNHISLRNWSEIALRKMTSVVEQRVHIFSATLRDNLCLAAPNADDNQLNTVIQQVGLDKLLIGEGLNTWLGDGGRTLSGGERSRIGIARAILHDAPLWLLDEPTDGLDPVTEYQILHLLDKLTQGRTVVIVTHQLRGLENFDHIYVLDRGVLIEHGSHQSLMSLRAYYYHYHYPPKLDSQ